MSARKLGRLAGLVFVLAGFLGGAGAFNLGVGHEAGGLTVVVDSSVVTPDGSVVDPELSNKGVDWA